MAGESWKSHKRTTQERDLDRDHQDQLAELPADVLADRNQLADAWVEAMRWDLELHNDRTRADEQVEPAAHPYRPDRRVAVSG